MKLGDKIDKWEVVGIGSNHVLLRDGEEHLSVSKSEAERRVAKKKAPVKKKVTKKKANVRKTKKKD